MVCARCVCGGRWELCPWKIEEMSGPAPPTDVSIVSLLCVQDARMPGIWCTCLWGHVSPAFLHPLSFKMGLWAQAALGKGRGDWNHFLSRCSREELRETADTEAGWRCWEMPSEETNQTSIYSSFCEQLSFFLITLQHHHGYLYHALQCVSVTVWGLLFVYTGKQYVDNHCMACPTLPSAVWASRG